MKNKATQLKIKVIAGKLKNSNVFFQELPGLRPSLNRHRERLFAWLAPYLSESKVLDLYAGSGILGIEAISRGAKKATLIEKNLLAHNAISENLKRLNIDSIEVIHRDSLSWLLDAKEGYDIIFLDPPFVERIETEFKQSLLYLSLKQLFEKNLLNAGGLIYLELADSRQKESLINEILEMSEGLKLFRLKTFKRLSLILIEKSG